MIDTASLKLCKELYKLSGWEDTYFFIRHHKPNGATLVMERQTMTNESLRFRGRNPPEVQKRFEEENDFWPAYDLGFLVRKLPDYVKLFRNNEGQYYSAAVTANFRHPRNPLGSPDDAHQWYISDTPEDALSKLAIELFKSGVLVKEVK